MRPIITGILDWDSAVLAPCFFTCYPPLWLWAWRDDEDERTTTDDPGTEERRELRTQFDVAAGWWDHSTDGQRCLRAAYQAPYRLARRPVRFAIDGVRPNEAYEEAEARLEE